MLSPVSPSTSAKSIDLHIGLKIKQRRVQLGMSQEDLARELDTTWQQVMRYEKGENRISCGRLYEISRHLKTPLLWFFVGSPGVDLPEHLGDSDEPEDSVATELLNTLKNIRSQSHRLQLLQVAKLFAEIDQEHGKDSRRNDRAAPTDVS